MGSAGQRAGLAGRLPGDAKLAGRVRLSDQRGLVVVRGGRRRSFRRGPDHGRPPGRARRPVESRGLPEIRVAREEMGDSMRKSPFIPSYDSLC
jgi:hypothetical protein